MDELWVKEMDEYPHFLRLLKLRCHHAVPLSERKTIK